MGVTGRGKGGGGGRNSSQIFSEKGRNHGKINEKLALKEYACNPSARSLRQEDHK